MVLMAPADEAELMHMIATQVAYNNGPSALRFPRGEGVGIELPQTPQVLEIGKGRIVKQGSDIAILSYGTRLRECEIAIDILNDDHPDLSVTLADARFAKPLDIGLIRRLAATHRAVITIEEGSIGGFGAHVLQFMADDGLLDNGKLKIRTMHLPDRFQDHDKPEKQYAAAGLDADQIRKQIISLL